MRQTEISNRIEEKREVRRTDKGIEKTGGGEVGFRLAAVRLGFSGKREEKKRVKRREQGVSAKSMGENFSYEATKVVKIKKLLLLKYSIAIPS